MRNTLSDRDGIAQTIDLYFAGMYQSKAEDIEASFHPNATITGFRGDTGEPFEMTLDSVDIKGKVAMVRVTDRYLNKRFTDLMLLLKTDDGWRIYSKLWHAEPL
ncbi:MAG: nuclear transport factor 2 family protein [Alphaproteobacteria bacterium]|nr:nuclear transport factor 2 family protein [Alphaproteobacteria bacterium]